MRETVHSDSAPVSPFYAQAIRAGGFVYVSGTTGVDPATGAPAGPTIEEQTERALLNCQAILASAGAALDDVVEVGVLLADPDDFVGMNTVWARWFAERPPTRWVGRLGPVLPGVLISIRVTAYSGT